MSTEHASNTPGVRERLLILGSTGSIGVSTLDVLARHPDRFSITALAAHTNIERLAEQAQAFYPAVVAITDPHARDRWVSSGLADQVQAHYRKTGRPVPQVIATHDELCALCASDEVDTVVAAIVGAAGLHTTLAAARAGKKVLLANKESLVLAGHVLMDAAHASGARILPVDSEHNAIFQALPAGYDRIKAQSYGIRSLILTASGGPFLHTELGLLESMRPEQAIAHPNWSMGKKISVDSATMANKGLEVIEAFWLFGLPVEQIQVVIHPQSIIHSLVEYVDGSMVAQLGQPDMRTPIAHVLGFPDRLSSGVGSLNLTGLSGLTFCAPDLRRFPALALAFEALKRGDSQTAVFNAANEVAVQAFLDERIRFTDIARVIEWTMERISPQTVNHLEVALDADRAARQIASQFCSSIGR